MNFLPKLVLWLVMLAGIYVGITKVMNAVGIVGIVTAIFIGGCAYFFVLMKYHFEAGANNG